MFGRQTAEDMRSMLNFTPPRQTPNWVKKWSKRARSNLHWLKKSLKFSNANGTSVLTRKYNPVERPQLYKSWDLWQRTRDINPGGPHLLDVGQRLPKFSRQSRDNSRANKRPRPR